LARLSQLDLWQVRRQVSFDIPKPDHGGSDLWSAVYIFDESGTTLWAMIEPA
jgi:hypothetical protein